MANNQRLNSTITIGAALQSSVRNSIGVVQAGLREVGTEIKAVTTRQKELDRQRKVLERQGQSVEDLDREYKQLTETLDRLRNSQRRWQAVSASSVKVGQAYGNMTRDVGRLARNTTIAIGAASGAIFGLAKSTADLGDNVAKTADKMGVQIGALQELRYAAERSGVPTETLDKALLNLARRSSEAAMGIGEAREAFKELGLDAAQMASLTPDEQMNMLADALAGVENQSDRVRLAFKFFEAEGVGMVNMLRDGSAGLEQLRADARATGYVLSDEAARDAEEFTDRLLDVKLGIAGLKNTIGSALMPVVTEAMSQFRFWLRENQGRVQQFAAALATGLQEAMPHIVEFGKGLMTVGGAISSVIRWTADLVGGFDRLAVIIGAAFAAKAVFSVIMFGKAVIGLVGSLAALSGGLRVATTGIKAIGLALTANPIGLVVAAVAGAAFLIIKNWEPISAFFGRLWDQVTGVFSGAVERIQGVLQWSPLAVVSQAWQPVADWFGGLWDGIIDSARKAFDWIAGKLEWVGNAVGRVRSFFGFGGDENQPAGSAAPEAQAPAIIRDIQARQASQPAVNRAGDTNSYIFNINGVTNPDAVADAVRGIIERQQRQRDSAALYDTAGAF